MKYETVIGIIGKTHGVSSERAPNVKANHINPQIVSSELDWVMNGLLAVCWI
jgi:hypothetical protein